MTSIPKIPYPVVALAADLVFKKGDENDDLRRVKAGKSSKDVS